MMMFGGKLMMPKKAADSEIVNDPIQAQKVSLKTLSKQEKLLLIELQRTRQTIVDELKNLDPMVAANSWVEIQDTINVYKQKIDSDYKANDKTKTHKNKSNSSSSSNSNSLILSSSIGSNRFNNITTYNKSNDTTAVAIGGQRRIRTGIDMLPVLASNGEAALEVGLKRQCELKLPVFKLPTLDPTRIQSILSESAVYNHHHNHKKPSSPSSSYVADTLHASTVTTSRRTIHRDPLSHIKAISIMYKQLKEHEIKYITSYLNIDRHDINNIEEELRTIHRVVSDEGIILSKTVKKRNRLGPMVALVLNCINNPDIEQKISVFMRIKQQLDSEKESRRIADIHASSCSSSTAAAVIKGDRNKLSEFSRSVSSGMLDHDSPSLDGNKSIRSAYRSIASSKKQSKAVAGNSNSSSGSNSKKNVYDKPLKYQQSQDIESNALKMELLQSLRSMQQHTDMVKGGILNVQSIVNLKNPKAKSFIFNMAAEALAAALGHISHRELERGWKSWKLAVRQVTIAKVMVSYVSFQSLRQVAIAMNNLVMHVLGKKMSKWITYTIKEKTRIRAIIERNAVLDIQRVVRGYLGRLNVAALKDRKKYEKLYKSVIKIQKIIRGKVARWRYLKVRRARRRERGARILQRAYRGYRGRVFMRIVKLTKKRNASARMIQALARGRLARKKVKVLARNRNRIVYIIKCQSYIRGFLDRCRVLRLKTIRMKDNAAISIQKIARGKSTRLNINTKKKHMLEVKQTRYTACVKIQALLRGCYGRLIYATATMDARRRLRKEANASTSICNSVRYFLARKRVKRMRKKRYTNWLDQARAWVETWSIGSDCYFYLNESTGESLWEPPRTGYTKASGGLVLESGEIIDDPSVAGAQQDVDDSQSEWMKRRQCVECGERVATRACVECGDKFCTKCYKATHATGTRREHTYKPTGPVDCSECEDLLAERWCVSCDEAFCDSCWRKVHSRGKRKFHPFCEVSMDGRIDSRIFTIDGQQVEDYDSTYAQQRLDNEPADGDEYAITNGVAGADEWASAYDDDGNIYYYNSATGVSQYEDPYAYGEQY